MARRDPFDQLGVDPGASEKEIERAYRRRVVERHRRGVWAIADQLRQLQRAFRLLSDPATRERQQQERTRRDSVRPMGARSERRQLGLLREYKHRMNRDLERIGAENAARHAAELMEISRELDLEELRARSLARRRRIAAGLRRALLILLLLSVAAALWIATRAA